MKKLLSLSLLLFSMFLSCKDDVLIDKDAVNESVKLKSSTTAITSTVFDWEQMTFINVVGLGNRTLPWYNGAETQLPFSILTDYSKSDGWEMIYNYINDPLVTYTGKYYLIFYNKFTGIMRVFYYNIYDVTSASTSFWSIVLNQTCSLLNNSSGHFAFPISVPQVQPTIYISNMSATASKGITRGWNAFDIEFTYDPNAVSKEMKMSIASYGVSTSSITLTGDLHLSSEGTIISKSNSNIASTLLNSAVSGFGEGVKTVCKSFCDSNKVKSPIKDALTFVTSTAASTILSTGANLIFGSFLSQFNKTNTSTQNINIKTNGKLQITGEISSNISSNIIPLSNLIIPGTQTSNQDNFLPSYSENFGVWNILNSPIVWFSDERIYESSDKINYNAYQTLQIDPSSIQLSLNPSVADKINNYEVRLDLVHYDYYDFGQSSYKTLWGRIFNSALVPYCDNFSDQEINNSQQVIFNDKSLLIRRTGQYGGYNLVVNTNILSSSGVQEYTRYDNARNRLSDYIYCKRNSPLPSLNYVAKVTLVLYPKSPYNTSPIILTRSYIPQYVRKTGLLDPVGW